MLFNGVNDAAAELEALAEYAADLRPAKAYISIPTGLPLEPCVKAPDEATLLRAYVLFAERHESVELLVDNEGIDFATLGDAKDDLLNILAVHPMREEAVLGLMDGVRVDRSILGDLVAASLVSRVSYGGHLFYIMRPPHRKGAQSHR